MTNEELIAILDRQRAYFASGRTLPPAHRLAALRRLEQSLCAHEADIAAALRADLGKSAAESYLSEVGLVKSELHFMLRHLRQFAAVHRVPTPLGQFAARSFTAAVPKGTVLIMSPWNYPVMLSLDPLIDAVAAGNTVIVKPSAYAPASCAVVQTILAEAFDPGHVTVVTGGRAENQALLEQKFDHIFFTGSQAVGREVLRKAAAHLTPVTLELGGKSPCIVDETADLRLAARRIVFGKFINCGQTCVAPDYLCVHKSVAKPLLIAIRAEIRRQLGEHPLENPAYGHIISRKHFDRLAAILAGEHVVFGGQLQPQALRIAPAVVGPCSWESPAMQAELFGPILPVLVYENLDALLQQINARPHPLALYFFSRRKSDIRRVLHTCPFGGVGASGMGAYHGRAGFETFSHIKSIVDKKTFVDLPMRYQPYTDFYGKLVRLFLG